MTNSIRPGFLRLSKATARLEAGMWGALSRPIPVVEIKRADRDASVGSGPWREAARRRLGDAAKDGELQVYVIAEGAEPEAVPSAVLAGMPTSRGGFGDVASRTTVRSILAAGGSETLFTMLSSGYLAVSEAAFSTWYQAERRRGRWASQRSRSKSRGGRPTKQTEHIRSRILKLVYKGTWRAETPIADLHRILSADADSKVPSPDTLARLVDQLFAETGESGLLRVRRRPPQAQR
jgi:hypothetical protein